MQTKNLLKKLSIMALLLSPLSAAPVSAGTLLQNGVPFDAAIMRAGSVAPKISKIKTVPSVGVVYLKKYIAPRRYAANFESVDDFRLAIDKNYAGVKRLRAALNANPTTRRALKSRSVTINRVVAADVSTNGSIRVYLF